MDTNWKLRSLTIAVVVALATMNVALADLDEGLVAHWTFHHGVACDVTCNGHQGVVDGPLKIEGCRETWLWFDGVDDQVAVADTSGMEFANASCTMTAWVKIGKDTNDYDMIVSLADVSDSDDCYPYIELGKARSGHIGGRLYFQVGTDVDVYSRAFSDLPGSSLVGNDWIHVAGVIDEDLDEIRLYINGVLQQHLESLVDFELGQAEQLGLLIGDATFADQWAGFFEGPIDEVRIYDRALTDDEISDLAAGRCPADINCDGKVDIDDIFEVLANWGDCPG